jgi:phthiodiolone/phenolphthiodiolone dimycocerosates ketoreductase
VARFEEAIATIRALWNSGGELVTRDSPFFPLHNAIFDLPPYKGKWPEVWIASHMPRMLRITGRYADAWFPAFIFDAKSYAAGLEVIRGAASDAGRDPASITPANWHIVVTGRSRDEVDEALSSDVMKAIALNLPADIWANHGVRHPLGAEFIGGQDLVPQVLDEETVLSYTRDVPLSMLKECMLTGTPDDVIEQFADWRDQGVRYPVVCNISGLQPSLRKGMAATIPLTRILRGLRKL